MTTTSITSTLISVENIYKAKVRLKGISVRTPLQPNLRLSEKFGCGVDLKREDLQVVRSYKIRGAYNKMASLPPEKLERGIVCASAGNHAQGVAFSCYRLGVEGTIYMPVVTPQQKVKKVRGFGKDKVKVVLVGDTFDEAYHLAWAEAEKENKAFVHPFDDEKIMEGQATIGLEILEDSHRPIDVVVVPVGGGGLAAGLGSYFKQISPNTKIIGVEPQGAPAMFESLRLGEVVTLPEIDSFVDGAAVRKVGDKTFDICRGLLDDLVLVPEGKVCSTILELYNEDGIVVEPAGALAIAALDQLKPQLAGKQVVCVVSGSNNDITRTGEIRERALLYDGLKHYFIVRFPQRAGALRDFLNNVLGPKDDITHFEYTKKHNRGTGPALVGIQVQEREDYKHLIERMEANHVNFQTVNDQRTLFELII